MTGSRATSSSDHAGNRIRRVGVLFATAVLGGITGLVGILIFTASQNRGQLPTLEPEDFYASKRRWSENGPPDYRLSVRVTGRQAAEYEVEVRGGQVISALRNGQPLKQRRTMGTWSVPGMFGTIQSDVTNLEKRRAGKADQTTPQVLLRGEFDLDLGYPVRYHRTELQKWGNNVEVTWEVTSFEALPTSEGDPPIGNQSASPVD